MVSHCCFISTHFILYWKIEIKLLIVKSRSKLHAHNFLSPSSAKSLLPHLKEVYWQYKIGIFIVPCMRVRNPVPWYDERAQSVFYKFFLLSSYFSSTLFSVLYQSMLDMLLFRAIHSMRTKKKTTKYCWDRILCTRKTVIYSASYWALNKHVANAEDENMFLLLCTYTWSFTKIGN